MSAQYYIFRGSFMGKSLYIECGKIINTHGFRGGVKLESWCDSPDVLASLKRMYLCQNGEYRCLGVVRSSIFKQFVIAEFDGINDMDSAIALKNTVLYAAREDFELKDGEYFIADLIGIDVIDFNNGKIYGKITDIINRGASDIYVVDTPVGERMIPAVPEFIKKTDPNSGVYVVPIEGLLD